MFFKLVEYLNNRKNYPYYFISPLIYSYGNSAEQIYLISTEPSLKNKKIIILNYNYLSRLLKFKICNKSLFNNIIINGHNQKSFNFYHKILNFFVFLEFFFRRTFIIYFLDNLNIRTNELKRFPYLGLKKLYSFDSRKDYKSINSLSLEQSKISLNLQTRIRCESKLENYDLKNRKIITLHVRDFWFKNDNEKKNYRNANINSYIELIKYLINKDYLIFRIGTHPCNKISLEDKNFINYPELDIQSPELDLYLVENSEFFIGTSSGPRGIAEMFSKPTLITNSDDFSDLPIKKNDRVLYKKFKLNNKYLMISELLKLDADLFDPELYLDHFEIEENSNEEILDAGIEFLENIEKKKFELSEKQKKFNFILKEKMKNYYTINDNNKLKYHIDSQKYIKRCKSMNGSACNMILN